jgi:hypothetical protein
MRNVLNIARPTRRHRKVRAPQWHCAEALRACELAAIRAKYAADELADRWAALTHEVAQNANVADLQSARSWCHVLEIRLKERLTALEEARYTLDNVLRQQAVATGHDAPLSEVFAQSHAVDDENSHWSLFAQSPNSTQLPVPATPHRSE